MSVIRTGDPHNDRIELALNGQVRDITVGISDVDGLTSYSYLLDFGVLGRQFVVLDLFHPEPPDDDESPPQDGSDRELFYLRGYQAGVRQERANQSARAAEDTCSARHWERGDFVCTRPSGHEGEHGYAGCFWSDR